MSEQLRVLIQQVLALPRNEQVEVLNAIEVSLGPSAAADASWAAELRRRRDAVLAGTEEVLDWSEARKLIHVPRE